MNDDAHGLPQRKGIGLLNMLLLDDAVIEVLGEIAAKEGHRVNQGLEVALSEYAAKRGVDLKQRVAEVHARAEKARTEKR